LLISESYVRAIEIGSKKPSKRLLRDYANLLNIEEDILESFDRLHGEKSTKEYLYRLITAVNERVAYLSMMKIAHTIGEYKTDDKQTVTAEYADGARITLYKAIPSCKHEVIPQCSGGIICTKCGGWFCY
jgi:transcriptional regulator with XRE-family HTH domain